MTNQKLADWIRAHPHWVAIGLLLLVTMAVYAFRFDRNWLANDDSFYLDVTVRLMQGEVAYRDIALLHTPGFFLYLWPFLSLLGVSLLSGKVALALLGITTVLMTYRLAQRILSIPLSIICALMMIALGPLAFYTLSASWLAGLFVIGALDSLIAWMKDDPARKLRPLFWAGLWLGLAFSVKQPYGLFPGMAAVLWMMVIFSYAEGNHSATARKPVAFASLLAGFIAFGMVLLVVALFKPVASKLNFLVYFVLPLLSIVWISSRALRNDVFQASQFPKAFGWLILGGLCGLIPMTLYQGIAGGLTGILTMYKGITMGAAGSMQRFYYPISMRLFLPAALPELLMLGSLCIAWFRPRIGLWLMLGACVLIVMQNGNLITMQMSIYWIRLLGMWLLAAASFLILRQNDSAWQPAALPILLMTLTSVFLMLTVYPYPDPVYLIYAIVPFLLGLALLWQQFSQRLSTSQPSSRVMVRNLSLAMLVLIFGAQIWVFLMHPGLLRHTATQYLDTPRGGIYIDEPSMKTILPAVQFLELQKNLGTPVKNILVLPDGPQLYFLSGHPNPTPYYDLQQPLTPEMERYYIALLGRQDLDYVFLTDYHLNYRNFEMPPAILQYLNEHYWMQGMAGGYSIFEHRK